MLVFQLAVFFEVRRFAPKGLGFPAGRRKRVAGRDLSPLLFLVGVGFEEGVEREEVVLVGAEGGVGDAVFFEEAVEAFGVAGAELVVAHADIGVGGVDEAEAPGLGVAEVEASGLGEAFLGGVGEAEGDEFVAVGEEAEGAGEVGVEEVGEEEEEGLALEDAEEEAGGGGEVGGALAGAGGEDFPDDAEDVGVALGGGEVEEGSVGEEEEAGFVPVGLGGEGEDGGDLGGEFLFAEVAAAVAVGGGDVDGEDGGEFAFLAELADEGLAGAGGDVPVDVLGVVAVLVFAEVVEVEALAFEGGVVVAGEGLGDEFLGPHLEAVDALHDLGDVVVVGRAFRRGGGHGGRGKGRARKGEVF